MGGRGTFSRSSSISLIEKELNARSIGEWIKGRGEDGEKFSEKNFMSSSVADFVKTSKPNREPDYKSSSGSEYWYENDGVIRGSDHWGGDIGSCDWLLGGKGYSSYSEDAYGFAKFSDFKVKDHMITVMVSDRIDSVVSDKARLTKHSNESMLDAYRRIRSDLGLSSDSSWNAFKKDIAEKVKKRMQADG